MNSIQSADPISKKTAYSFPDLVPNVDFQDATIRFGCTLMIPMVMLGINKYFIIYTAPVVAYLLVTAIAHFCVVKYVWVRYVKRSPASALIVYSKDPDYPEESVAV